MPCGSAQNLRALSNVSAGTGDSRSMKRICKKFHQGVDTFNKAAFSIGGIGCQLPGGGTANHSCPCSSSSPTATGATGCGADPVTAQRVNQPRNNRFEVVIHPSLNIGIDCRLTLSETPIAGRKTSQKPPGSIAKECKWAKAMVGFWKNEQEPVQASRGIRDGGMDIV